MTLDACLNPDTYSSSCDIHIDIHILEHVPRYSTTHTVTHTYSSIYRIRAKARVSRNRGVVTLGCMSPLFLSEVHVCCLAVFQRSGHSGVHVSTQTDAQRGATCVGGN